VWGVGEALRAHLAGAEIVARGPKVRGAIRAAGLKDAWAPESELMGEVLDRLLARDLDGTRIVVQLHGDPLREAVDALRAAGAHVMTVPVYRWTLPADVGPAERLIEQIVSGELDAVTFTSAPAVAGLLEVADRAGRRDAVLVAIGGGLVLAGLSNSTPALAIALLVAGIVVGVPALRRVTPTGTLTGRTGLGAAVLVRGLLTFAFFGTEAFLPLMLREARGLSPTLAGIVLTTGAVTWTAGSWVHERLAPRLVSRTIITTSFLLVALGACGVLAVLLFASLPVEVAYLAWAVSGSGIGFGYAAISVLVLRLAPAGQVGATGAAMQVLDNLGTAFGTGVGGAAIAIAVARGLPVAAGIAAAFCLAVAGALAGLAVARRLDASRPSVIDEDRAISAPSLG